jgi:spermidine synthase
MRHVERAGSVAGGYSALSTAGSIAGTLLTTFVLIPRFPVRMLLMGLAAALAGCALLIMRNRTSVVTGALSSLTWAAAAFRLAPIPSTETVLLRKDTPYHHIIVTQVDQTRWLRFDNLTQSAVNLTYPDRIVGNGYPSTLMLAFAMRPAIRNVCVVGLGGGTVPRAVARVRPESLVESVEIDPAVRDIAQKYFLYRESDRLRTFVEDGRLFLARPGTLYDFIVQDAFNSDGVPFHLTTREFYDIAKSRMAPGGLFAANFAGRLMGKDGKLFWATYRAARARFGQVYVHGLTPDGRVPESNVVLFAFANETPLDLDALVRGAEALEARWKLPGLTATAKALVHSPPVPDGIPLLSDEYAPVEALQNF